MDVIKGKIYYSSKWNDKSWFILLWTVYFAYHENKIFNGANVDRQGNVKREREEATDKATETKRKNKVMKVVEVFLLH